jgi:hypothetical protein
VHAVGSWAGHWHSDMTCTDCQVFNVVRASPHVPEHAYLVREDQRWHEHQVVVANGCANDHQLPVVLQNLAHIPGHLSHNAIRPLPVELATQATVTM